MKYELNKTDFYQVAMVSAYIFLGQADEECGFEAFVRNIKPIINPDKNFYVFSGERAVREFMETVRTTVTDPYFVEDFIAVAKPKFPEYRREQYEKQIRSAFATIRKDFVYDVYPEGGIVKPYVPVFQYRGPKWIGQLIETRLLNIINGVTGVKTRLMLAKNYDEYVSAMRLTALTHANTAVSFATNDDFVKYYLNKLKERAVEYREATSKILLEACYRRAPSFEIALAASKIALANGWNGTSNTSILAEEYADEQVGGTMAHSFIMSQRSEIDAYRFWASIFPNSTMLIDTYDILNGVMLLINNKIKPACVRIDSDPLVDNAFMVRRALDNAGWNAVQIFLSGDITPELLREFTAQNVPFDKAMAGTEYVNIVDAKSINAGYVYKLVEITKQGDILYPEKKANGKTNYSGLKYIDYESGKIIVRSRVERKGLVNAAFIQKDTEILFKEGY